MRRPDDWFDDLTVLGKMPPSMIAAKLEELGQPEMASLMRQRSPTASVETYEIDGLSGWLDRPWKHAAHAYGFIEPGKAGSHALLVRHAGDMDADQTLKNSRVKVTLDRLRVAGYPGFGTHQILFDFYARNQVPQTVEHLHFNATYRAADGEQAGLIGCPIFVGLNVGPEGVDFRGVTVNVKNEEDERFLSVLETDVFKAGLKLATTAQPAIAPLAGLAVGLTRAIAQRSRNATVQKFDMGLDFSNIPTRARLRAGSYVVVQIPERLEIAWDWTRWVFHPSSGQLVAANDPRQLIPYNYIVLGVSAYEGD